MTRVMQHQRAVYKLGKRLQQTAVHSRLEPDSLRTYVRGLKQQFLRETSVSNDNDSPLEEWKPGWLVLLQCGATKCLNTTTSLNWEGLVSILISFVC